MNNGDENTQTDGQNTTDPNTVGVDPEEKNVSNEKKAIAAEDITVTAGTVAEEYAYKEEVALKAEVACQEDDFDSENVTWQWQKRKENADDESAWTNIDGANDSSYSFTYDETNWAQMTHLTALLMMKQTGIRYTALWRPMKKWRRLLIQLQLRQSIAMSM